jgi:UDP-N-acetylmuramate dehydrogenase
MAPPSTWLLCAGGWLRNNGGDVTAESDAHAVERLARALAAVLGPEAVRANEPLARYTALRIGGPADVLVVADSGEALRLAVSLAWEQQVPCRVLGGGSNVLVSDAGIRGLVVLNRAKAVTFFAGGVRAESGAFLSTLAQQCVSHGLAGLEWAAGIPGTVGGAVVGNAGAWGGDVASALVRAVVLEPPGVVTEWPVQRFGYGYRQSILKQGQAGSPPAGAHPTPPAVVLEAEFALQAGRREELRALLEQIIARRRASQPPGASCGSVFRNPAGDFAGRLIEAAGLKGQRCGGAEISPVHANFIINHGGASAADVQALIDLVCQGVQAQCGVSLEPEIERIGDWQRENWAKIVPKT